MEKPEKPKSTLAATGIYFFKNSSIKLLDEYINEGNDLEGPGLFIKWLFPKRQILGYVVDFNQWHDIGSVEIYKKLNG